VSVFFIDSSALIKRYAAENGTNWILSIARPSSRNHILISQLTPVEIVSGLARKQREAHLSARTLQAAMLLINRHTDREYVVIVLAKSVEERAKTLLTTYPLRAYDAVQLASALISEQQVTGTAVGPVIFVSAYSRLRTVAANEGLATEDPNNHP
jgi:predicted nucleic acid-binding protein